MTVPSHRSPEALWRVEDVAKFLSLSESWVYKSAADGSLPSVRIGAALRFDPEQIRKFAKGELTTTVVRRSKVVSRAK
jgi:excisionase family DNA binding protein